MAPANARKVLLVGWDAADWKIIHPLLDAGRMPHLSRLIEGGVMGQLATLHPPYSPMLWTSIATGMRPFKHGVLGFVEPAADGRSIRPVTSLSRKVKAIWNIVHQRGLRSNVVGWWPSHPAEPINGVMVSDHYSRAFGPPEQPWPMPAGCVHPPALREVLAELRLNPNELDLEHLLPFIPRAAKIDQEKDRRLASCMKILAEAVSIQSAATWLIQNQPWDFMAVYFDAIDHFCHAFMKYHPPRMDFIPEEDFELYHQVVQAAYEFHDLMLGELVRLAGDEVTVLLLSDHGFHPDHLRPKFIPEEPAGPALEHRDFGILVLNGPGLKRDELIFGASLLDITPTLLTLYGLPVAEDMDGNPLLQAFAQPPPVQTIRSWETVDGPDSRLPPDQRFDPLAGQEVLNQLVELGYVEKPSEDVQEAVASTLREWRFNLALSYRDAGLDAEALEPLRELHAADPDEFRFALHLAWTCQALGRLAEMAAILDDLRGRRREAAEQAQVKLDEWRTEALRRLKQHQAEGRATPAAGDPLESDEEQEATPEKGPRPEPLLSREERLEVTRLRRLSIYYPQAVGFLDGQLKLAQGDYAAALECWLQAEEGQANRPGIYIQLGQSYLGLRRYTDAERSFQKALTIDPDNPHAYLGLCRSYLPRGKNQQAAECALQTVQRLHHYPLAHFCLGLALARLRMMERAAEAFAVAISLNPHFAQAHRHLARLYRRWLNQPERAREHLRLAQEMEAQPGHSG
jgi:predicted AlkP superfamily phosphohydrolase/phosphomutase/Tfp pilus assembly protein PilF